MGKVWTEAKTTLVLQNIVINKQVKMSAILHIPVSAVSENIQLEVVSVPEETSPALHHRLVVRVSLSVQSL